MNGVREFIIMKQTGHKTVATLRRYIRSGEIFARTRRRASGSNRSPTPGRIHFSDAGITPKCQGVLFVSFSGTIDPGNGYS